MPTTPATLQAAVGAANLAECVRRFGHLSSHLDPLGSAPIGDPSLSPDAHGISDDDLKQLPASIVGGPVVELSANAYEAIERLLHENCRSGKVDLMGQIGT